MIEGDFRRDLQKGMESQGAWAYKLPDLARGMLKPCDLVVGYHKRLLLVECKLNKYDRQKPIGNQDVVLAVGDFRPHQLPTLWQVEEWDQATACVAVLMVNATQRGWKMAWMLPAAAMRAKHFYSFGELLQPDWLKYQLQWVPKVGWQVNWSAWESE